jgi:hypothetical protein
MSVLFALNSEEYVCRKVCHPICCVIPTFAAARRIIVRIRHWPQYGLCPCAAVLANTQSSAWLYFVWSRHILRAAARRESRGTGFCDASVLQGPTTWKTIERVTLSSFFWKSMSPFWLPFHSPRRWFLHGRPHIADKNDSPLKRGAMRITTVTSSTRYCGYTL